MNIEKAQNIAVQLEQYAKDHKLYYGPHPRNGGKMSWMIGLENLHVSLDQAHYLQTVVPSTVMRFHERSLELMQQAFLPQQTSSDALLLRKLLTQGVPEETIALWDQAAKRKQEIFSTRPDMIILPDGTFKIIEYNTDGGADKGNTQGVNDYAQLYLDEEILGTNLAREFILQIRAKYPKKRIINVATVIPDDYRQEYEAQNRYFGNIANELGNAYGITWYTFKLSEIQYTGKGVIAIHNGERIIIDVVDREFKLPGFNKGNNFAKETKLIQASLTGQVDMLGSILPYGDKILLSTIHDLEIASLHAETGILTGENTVHVGTNTYALDDLRELRPEIQFVIKRGGDTDRSTGSKGLVISTDIKSHDEWKKAMDDALTEPLSGGQFWVIQKYYPSQTFEVPHIESSRSQPHVLTVGIRFAPYYVQDKTSNLNLGNVLATAATDEETRKKNWHNIHGLKGNTYMGVAVE